MIQIQSLSCHYGDKAVLDTVSLELSEARVAVVGRNGSGKSTLAKAISGLIRPEQGRILINGVDVLKDRKAALSAVGILFQNPDHQIIFPTVEEEISLSKSDEVNSISLTMSPAEWSRLRFGSNLTSPSKVTNSEPSVKTNSCSPLMF